jgi:thiol:disulfide interchange protein DsbC
MKPIRNALVRAMLLAGAVTAAIAAQGQEATIRKNLGERLPQLGKIEEVSKTPISGLYELRAGTDLFYSDAEGNYLIRGNILDTKQQRNLTQEREAKLLAIDFSALPLEDAFTIVRGNGKRKVAIFEDPNCGYCKRFERELQKVDNITVHLFLYPILGSDSTEKSRNLWCTKERAQAWQDWMLRGKAAPSAQCDAAALARNVEFGRMHKISGTPTMILADGTRVPGAVSVQQVEQLLSGKQ